MAQFKILKGVTDSERLVSADGLINALDRKVSSLQMQCQKTLQTVGLENRQAALENKIAAIMAHLGVSVEPNTTVYDVVPQGSDLEGGK